MTISTPTIFRFFEKYSVVRERTLLEKRELDRWDGRRSNQRDLDHLFVSPIGLKEEERLGATMPCRRRGN